MNAVMTTDNRDLDNISVEQFNIIEKLVQIDDLKSQYTTARKAAVFNTSEAIEGWLANTEVYHTKRMYTVAIDHFLEYTKGNVLDITVAMADGYIRFLKQEKRAGKTVKLYVSAVSAFYSHLERYSEIEKNPFKGTKVKIDNTPAKDKVIPTVSEIEALCEVFSTSMIKKASVKMLLAMKLMVKYGVRKGFIDDMNYCGNTIVSYSKGKEYIIEIDSDDMEYFQSVSYVFPAMNSRTMSENFNKTVRKLYDGGKISAKFSPHSLRHFFAINYYEGDKDMYRLCRLLNHSSISVTENYLRELKIK